jgi:hypothetical protein
MRYKSTKEQQVIEIIESRPDLSVDLRIVGIGDFTSWAVGHPDLFNTEDRFTTWPDEASARDFYYRMIKVREKELR